MRRAAALLAALALAGCGGGDDDAAGTATQPPATTEPPATTAATTTTARPLPPPPRAAVEAERAFRDFLRAGAREDAAALWDGLTAGSQERLGPTEQEFTAEAAEQLRGGLGSVDPEQAVTVALDAPGNDWAVVAVRLGETVFATPLKREGDAWRVDIGGVVTVDAEAPRPGGTPSGPLIRARVDAGERPAVTRLYLDGRPLPTTLGQSGVFAAPLGGLGPGEHTVVAYAQTSADAAATAWTFRVPG